MVLSSGESAGQNTPQLTAPGPPTVLVNGIDHQQWPSAVDVPVTTDNVSAAPAIETALVGHFRSEGYFAVRIDSVQFGLAGTIVHVRTGKRSYVGLLVVTGVSLFSEVEIAEDIGIRSGDPFRFRELEHGIRRLLESYGARSYQMAEIDIERIDAGAGSGSGTGGGGIVDIYVRVVEGAETALAGLSLPGSIRTKPSFVARELGLVIGAPFSEIELTPLEDRVRESGLFEVVGEAFVDVYEDSTLILSIPVKEGPPGTFDFVMGFLPASDKNSSGQLIGSGHLNLVNAFGYGRSFEIALDRLPGQVSSGRVHVSDPQVAGFPLRIDLGFDGYQRDSTYAQQSLSSELAYRFDNGFRAGVRYSRESTSPGQAGNRLSGAVQRIPTSTRTFVGLTVHVRNLDNPVNPRSGIFVETIVESGSKNESRLVVLPGADTTTVMSGHRQERLQMTVRSFLPMFSNQSLVTGVDLRVLRSPVYSESDLFRVGGASTLRGYDEERFLANVAVRILTEYRVLLDASSYAFAFADVGYLERPKISDTEGTSGWYPGYGLGMQWKTAAGLLNISYAINNEDGPTRGRIHVGLAFGL